jgi:hypothetical protein
LQMSSVSWKDCGRRGALSTTLGGVHVETNFREYISFRHSDWAGPFRDWTWEMMLKRFYPCRYPTISKIFKYFIYMYHCSHIETSWLHNIKLHVYATVSWLLRKLLNFLQMLPFICCLNYFGAILIFQIIIFSNGVFRRYDSDSSSFLISRRSVFSWPYPITNWFPQFWFSYPWPFKTEDKK